MGAHWQWKITAVHGVYPTGENIDYEILMLSRRLRGLMSMYRPSYLRQVIFHLIGTHFACGSADVGLFTHEILAQALHAQQCGPCRWAWADV